MLGTLVWDWRGEGTCLLGQPFIQTHPSWKTLVVHPMTRSTARHPWGAQRKENQVMCLSNPQTQPAASHTSLCFISGKRKHYHVFLSPLLCLPILTTSHKHFTEFLLRNLLWVDLDSVSFWGKTSHCWEAGEGCVCAPWPIVLAELGCHSVMPELRGGVVTSTSWQNIFLEHSGPRCFSISLSYSQGRYLFFCMEDGNDFWTDAWYTHRQTRDVLRRQIPKLPWQPLSCPIFAFGNRNIDKAIVISWWRLPPGETNLEEE